jgi:cardiolipin synthase
MAMTGWTWLLFSLALAVALLLVSLNFVTAERRLARRPPRWYGTESVDFERTVGTLLGPAILPGNRVDTLVNGDEIFPAMLEAIEGAQRSVCFETFIYWSGDIGRRMAEAFAAAARRGVTTHVLLDWLGCRRMDASLIRLLEESGVQVQLYHRLGWYQLGRINKRTHRKLLVVDGEIGFTGGVGIAPQWTGNAQDPDHWRDNHYRVRGPVVAQMQAVFLDNWIKTTGEVLHGKAYFPRLRAEGDARAQLFGSSPAGGSDSLHLLTLLSLTAASRTIDIANAYFVPDLLTQRALEAAAARGVRVRVLMPGAHTDAPIVRWASQAAWEELMHRGVDLYEYLPTMLHCKLMVVDDRVAIVGSGNFDNRSFRLNDESTLSVFDRDFALVQLELFERDLRSARRIVPHRWRRRAVGRRAIEWAASRLRSQL